MERKKNTARNTFFALLYYFLDIVLAFAVRTIFIRVLTTELLGVNGLFTNILNMLNLTELGIGTAIVYNMYKAIKDDDKEKITALFRLYRKIYSVLSLIVLTIGLCLIPALPYLVKGDNHPINLTIVYIPLLLNTCIGYLFQHYKSLFFANQRDDLSSKVKTLKIFVMYIAEILVLLVFKNFILYIYCKLIATLVEGIISVVFAKKHFPFVFNKTERKIEKLEIKEITKNTGAVSAQKLGNFMIYGTDNILISTFLGLTTLGLYSNYQLIVSAIEKVNNILINSMKGSVGNQVAAQNENQNKKMFNNILFGHLLFIGFVSICLFCLFNPFIELWIGKKYLFTNVTAFLLAFSFYLKASRKVVLMYRDTSAVFKYDVYKPFVESVLNIVLSLVLLRWFGINGVILGTILSAVLSGLWIEPRTLYKKYFKANVMEYYFKYLAMLLLSVCIGALTFFIINLIPSGFGFFILKGIICALLPACLYLLLTFRCKEMKFVFGLIKNIKKLKK